MILYSKFNTERKKCFQLITKIQKTNKTLFSSKSSNIPESQKFLNSFYKKYDILIKNKFSLIPIKPKKISDTEISFEYQKLPTLERLLLSNLKTKNKKKFISLINDYIELIKSNKIKIEFVNSKFKNIFGNFGTGKKMECLQSGCLDLNFDNIIVDEKINKYKIIDYEWIFDNITIPYKYIIFRSIYSFYDNFSSYNPNTFCPFEEILKLVNINLQEQKEFISFEYNFQYYVYGNKFKKNTKIDDYNDYYLNHKFSHNKNIFFEDILKQIENQNFNKPSTKNNKEIDELNKKFNKFQDSKIFKIWEKYNQIKKKLSNFSLLSKFS